MKVNRDPIRKKSNDPGVDCSGRISISSYMFAGVESTTSRIGHVTARLFEAGISATNGKLQQVCLV